MNRTMSYFRLEDESGVTLVELMVVIAVLGVLAALVGPTAFRTLDRQRSAGQARDFANELRRARNQAMSRGEIVIVDITPADGGTITTFATNVESVNGNYENGTTNCVSATEDQVGGTDNCPPDAKCINDRCYGDPARSCRQYVDDPGFVRQVATFDLQSTGDSVGLRFFNDIPEPPRDGTVATLCFSPDGRILTTQGVPVGGDPNACDGENLALIIGKDTAPATTAVCNAPDDQKEIHSVYRISVPYNGSIQMSQ